MLCHVIYRSAVATFCLPSLLQVYMVHGLPGAPVAMPIALQPVPGYDTLGGRSTAGPSTSNPSRSGGNTPQSVHTPQSDSNVSKPASRGRKKRGNKSKGSSVDDTCDQMDQLSMCGDPVRGAYSDPFALSVWGNMSSSESEFSDTEGATGKAKAVHSKVRHCVLACFHAVIKVCDGINFLVV